MFRKETIVKLILKFRYTGKIIHKHTILNMEGASPVDSQEKAKELLEFAKKELECDIN